MKEDKTTVIDDQFLLDNESSGEDSFNLQALVLKYLPYWPWFVASIVGCLVVCYLYLRFQTPVYNVSAAMLIKEEQKNSASGNNALAAMTDFGMFSMTNNFDNEIEILQSRTLVKKVVSHLGLYIQTSQARTFGYDLPLYREAPVRLYMTAEEADKLPAPVRVDMRYTPQGVLTVRARYQTGPESDEVELQQEFSALPAVLPTPVGVLSFMPNDSLQADSLHPATEDLHLRATVITPTAAANGYCGCLTVEAASKTTTIANVSVQDTHRQRAVDFINCLVAFYNRDTNDEKNEVARKSAEFIDERIAIINAELGTTESELAAFKQRAGLTDITSDAQQALQESSRYEQQRVANENQISLVTYLKQYIDNPDNRNEVLPANVGYADANLTSVIEQYNTLIIERQRLLRTSSETNPAVVNMNTGIDAMRRTVLTTVNSVLDGLRITRSDLARQASKFEGRISNAPLQEKEFMTISRQQELKAALYTMLLQKREENAITLAATANNGRLIEDAQADPAPVSPKKKMFMLVALVLGFGIPVAFIYLVDLLKYKIEKRSDVERITSVPIIGEIPMSTKGKKVEGEGAIVVRENKNDVMEETFRGLRTNLLFMLEKGQKVILFSSSQPSEGKSFIAGNTAVSLAYLGKKVIIVDMDIRKLGLNKVFNLSHHTQGITSYLSDPDHVQLSDLIQHSHVSPNLDILPGGSIPPNPTELVARDVLDRAIDQLKERYDYILLDTAPIGMVTDTAIIGRVADLCVYVCRADVTPKVAYGYINVLRDQKLFPKLATVINGIDMSKRKNSYGRKYGYGYGFEADNKQKKSK